MMLRFDRLHRCDQSRLIGRREFVDDLKDLAAADLSLDSANPTPSLIHGLLRTSDVVPNMRIVIDHLPKLEVPTDALAKKAYYADLYELGKRPRVFVKISSVLRRVNGRVPNAPRAAVPVPARSRRRPAGPRPPWTGLRASSG